MVNAVEVNVVMLKALKSVCLMFGSWLCERALKCAKQMLSACENSARQLRWLTLGRHVKPVQFWPFVVSNGIWPVTVLISKWRNVPRTASLSAVCCS